MSDILLDSEGDIQITGGKIKLIESTAELTKQRLLIKMRTFYQEWYLNTLVGVPYFQEILKRGSNRKTIADTVFKNIILQDEGVSKLNSFTSSVSPEGGYSLSFSASTPDGEIITIQKDLV